MKKMYSGNSGPKGGGSSGESNINLGLIEKSGIPDCPAHKRMAPADMVPKAASISVKNAGTTFKIKG